MLLKNPLSLKFNNWARSIRLLYLNLISKFDNLSINNKLNIGFGVLVALTFLVVARNYFGSFMATKNIKRTQELRVPTALTSAQAEANLLRMSSHVRGYLATGESEYRDLYQQARQDFEVELIRMINLLHTYSTPENTKLLQELQTKYQQWKVLQDQLFALRDNYFENQPALLLLKEEGEAPIAIILSEITKIIEEQAQRDSSSTNIKLLKDMSDFKSSFALLVSSLRAYLVTQDPSFRFEYTANYNTNQTAYNSLTCQQSLLTSSQQQKLNNINQYRDIFLRLAPQMFAIVKGNRHREDLYLFSTKAEPLTEEMFKLLQEIVASQQEALSIELETGNKSLIAAQWQAILGGVLGLMIAIWMTFLLREKIAAPIIRLTEATSRIMKGDFDSKAIIESGDEIGILAHTFNKMTYYLKESRQELENYSHVLEERTVALADAKEAAEAANIAKSNFLASMTHELRTPLNAILGFTNLMSRESNTTAKQRETLKIINKSGEHLLSLINDVLEVNKIEAGKTQLNLKKFDLDNLLNSLQEMLKLKAETKGLRLDFHISPNVPHYIETDEAKLRQVVINLLGNAIKFTQRGSVRLSVRKKLDQEKLPENKLDLKTKNSKDNHPQSTTLIFEVKDTGLGIASHELENLFQPFVQTEAGIKSQEGTGLGLTISRKFVQLMGGDIEVKSQLNQGSTFTFSIKVNEPEEAYLVSKSKQYPIRLADSQSSNRILIVEDKWENSLFLFNLLQGLGFEVITAENGEEGINLWRSWQPDLILMDWQMPIMNGLEATKYIKTHLDSTDKNTIIIALTANVFEQKRIESLDAGCDDFIGKPFQEEVLLEKIAQHLEIDYIYEEVAQSPQPLITKLENPQAKMDKVKAQLALMPPEWLEEFKDHALAADGEEILKLLEFIPEENRDLVEVITQFAENFDFDRILDLVN